MFFVSRFYKREYLLYQLFQTVRREILKSVLWKVCIYRDECFLCKRNEMKLITASFIKTEIYITNS